MPRYATPADLATYLGTTAPTDPAELAAEQGQLDRAADLVARVLRTSRVPVDLTGIPTDAAQRSAITRATCAQAAYWRESLDETGAGALYQSGSMAGVTLTRAARSGGRGAHPSGSRLAPAALDILTGAGLFSVAVRH